MRLFVILIIPRRAQFVKRSNKYLTKPDKYVTIDTRRTAKTVGGSNLPPEMEVSFMSVTDIVSILTLVINIIRLVFDMSNNKKK